MERKKWTNDSVKEEVEKVIDVLGLGRMPTRNEINMVTGSSALYNRISRSGGLYKLAEKLELKTKTSETKVGNKYEDIIAKKIQLVTGFNTELTSSSFPYDILVGGCVKIDVKYSSGYDYGEGMYYSFNLGSKIPKCDLFVFVCGEEKNLIIPAHIFYGNVQLSVGVESSYDVYKDYWEPIYHIHECLFHQEIFEDEYDDIIF